MDPVPPAARPEAAGVVAGDDDVAAAPVPPAAARPRSLCLEAASKLLPLLLSALVLAIQGGLFSGSGALSPRGHGHGGHRQQRLQAVEVDVQVPLSLMVTGGVYVARARAQRLCHACGGAGGLGSKAACRACGGRGVVERRFMIGPGFVQTQRHVCEHCGGQGVVFERRCPVCGGRRVALVDAEWTVELPPACPELHIFRLKGVGHEGPDAETGDVLVRVRSARHASFERLNEADLAAQLSVSLHEALLGFRRVLTHPDGHRIEVERGEVTAHGQVIELRGEGMRPGDASSRLLITVRVQFPSKLSPAQQRLLADALA